MRLEQRIELVRARLARTTCSLYVNEISESTELPASETTEALGELAERGLATPATWKLTDKGRNGAPPSAPRRGKSDQSDRKVA